MARGRGALWAALGAAGAAAGLALSPGAYAWLRRLTGREDDRRFYEEEPLDVEAEAPVAAVEVDDAPVEDVRLSLRARLQDVGVVRAEDAAAPIPPPLLADSGPAGGVEEARARLRDRAAEAARGFDAPAEDDAASGI